MAILNRHPTDEGAAFQDEVLHNIAARWQLERDVLSDSPSVDVLKSAYLKTADELFQSGNGYKECRGKDLKTIVKILDQKNKNAHEAYHAAMSALLRFRWSKDKGPDLLLVSSTMDRRWSRDYEMLDPSFMSGQTSGKSALGETCVNLKLDNQIVCSIFNNLPERCSGPLHLHEANLH
jgi:hypothetical protein